MAVDLLESTLIKNVNLLAIKIATIERAFLIKLLVEYNFSNNIFFGNHGYDRWQKVDTINPCSCSEFLFKTEYKIPIKIEKMLESCLDLQEEGIFLIEGLLNKNKNEKFIHLFKMLILP